MDGNKFLTLIAEQFGRELAGATADIKRFTTNSCLIGGYAEGSVREFVARMVAPLRVVRGAVIDERLCSAPDKVPELDTIVWSPSPAPTVFRAGEFALIPRSSCFGVLEIKRSMYSGAAEAIERVVENGGDLVGDVAARLLAQWREARGDPDYAPEPVLGVVCLREEGQTVPQRFARLRQKGKAVLLFEEDEGNLKANAEDIWRLINFLVHTRGRARMMDGIDFATIGLLRKDCAAELADAAAA